MPTPFQTVFDNNGRPVSNAKVCTYVAGTTTPAATYGDKALTTPNQNPIRTDPGGRFVAFLSPGASYKFVYQDASGTLGTCDGAQIKTVDNVSAVPSSSASLEVVGVAGELLTAGQAVYLSDGSGSKVAGQWYKADSAQAYSSISPEIGIVPATITTAASGTIRLAGQATGLSSLSLGSTYYIGTAGALTLSVPPFARKVGVADSTSTLVLKDIATPLQPWVDDFRLTLTTAVPDTTADVTAATVLYASPYVGNRIDLPDSNGLPLRLSCAEFSIAVPATTSTLYDVFAFNNSGACALELLAWTNDTTRATTVIRTTNGRLLKNGDNTRLYVGSMRTTTVSGQTEDSLTKRYVWNYYNRVPRPLQRIDATATWAYTTATLRQANASTSNQVDVVVGVAEQTLGLTLVANAANTNSTVAYAAIGQDSTSAAMSSVVGGYLGFTVANVVTQTVATVTIVPAVGRHFYAWLEESAAVGATTWSGTNSVTGMPVVSGLFGAWQG